MSDFEIGGGSNLDHSAGGDWKAASPRARRMTLVLFAVVLVFIAVIGVVVLSAIASMA